MSSAVCVKDLRKSYGANDVLKGISFEVKRGEIFALLGTNGAGKTTALECIEQIRRYDSGSIEFWGKTGVQLQSSTLPETIKAMEAVTLFAKWNRAAINMDSLKRMGVTEFKNKQYHTLSTGQKRRLHLALAMTTDPDIIFLDEPTAGLDVEGRAALHGEIRLLKQQGKTILMASHDMAEVEELCDRIAILKEGRIVFHGTAGELAKQMQHAQRIEVRFSADPDQSGFLQCICVEQSQEYLVFETTNLLEGLMELTQAAKEQGIQILDICTPRANLEQCFLDIAGEGQ